MSKKVKDNYLEVFLEEQSRGYLPHIGRDDSRPNFNPPLKHRKMSKNMKLMFLAVAILAIILGLISYFLGI